MPRHRATTRQLYTPYLRRFMSWKDKTDYAVGTNFTDAQLLEIRPSHIVRYMSLLAYGSEEPGDNDRATRRRSSGLNFVKKAIKNFHAQPEC